MQAANDSKFEDSAWHTDSLELGSLMHDFNPESDSTDQALLYFLTGRKVNDALKTWLNEVNYEDEGISTPCEAIQDGEARAKVYDDESDLFRGDDYVQSDYTTIQGIDKYSLL